MSAIRRAALEYCAYGWSVIPLRYEGSTEDKKKPLLLSWEPYQRKPATHKQVEDWWSQWPRANVGIITGAVSGLVAVDLDGPHAGDLLRQAGIDLGLTATVQTARGSHFLFRHPGYKVGNRARLLSDGNGSGVDIRGDAGYIVAPPSIHGSGVVYQWSTPQSALAALPDGFAALLSRPTARDGEPRDSSWFADAWRGAPGGQRNETAARLAGYWLRETKGNEVAAFRAMEHWATLCTPPMDIAELRTTIKSVARLEASKGRAEAMAGQSATGECAPVFTVEGDLYHCSWPHLGITAQFEQMTNHSSGLHAEITVERGGSHLHWARLNLSSSTARSGVAKLLETRTKGIILDWQDLMETACVKTAHAFRAPAPVVDLATIEPSAAVQYAVRPLITLHETNILYGDGGSAKSLLALAMALAVKGGLLSSDGKPLLPHPILPLIHGPVLYLDYETCEDEQASQLRRLAFDHCASLPSIHYRPAHRPLVEDISHIKAVIQRFGIVLLIVDSMAPACGGRPEEAETVLNFMNALRSLGPTVSRLVIAHVSKADGDRTRGRIFGSVFARNLARSCWEVRAADDDEGDALALGLFHEKVNRGRIHKPFGLRIAFTDQRITITQQDLMAHPSLAVSAPLTDRVRQLMGSGILSPQELGRQLEAKPERIKHAMEQIKRACGLGRREE